MRRGAASQLAAYGCRPFGRNVRARVRASYAKCELLLLFVRLFCAAAAFAHACVVRAYSFTENCAEKEEEEDRLR